MNTTNEMSEIAAGLGSGVSQDQIRTSIEYGEQHLQEIKDRGKHYLTIDLFEFFFQLYFF